MPPSSYPAVIYHFKRDYTAQNPVRFFARKTANLSVESRDYTANLRVNNIDFLTVRQMKAGVE
jgi:hypothetical protein